MANSGKLSVVAACVSATTILTAATYWFAGPSADSFSVGVEVFAKAIAVFWILGIGFTIASTIAIVALLRGEPRNLPIAVIALESLIFLGFIISVALS